MDPLMQIGKLLMWPFEHITGFIVIIMAIVLIFVLMLRTMSREIIKKFTKIWSLGAAAVFFITAIIQSFYYKPGEIFSNIDHPFLIGIIGTVYWLIYFPTFGLISLLFINKKELLPSDKKIL